MNRSVPKRLLGLLEQEREHLVSGDIDSAAKLLPAKTKLLDRFDATAMDRPMVERIQRAATRNRMLIEAARRGVETAHQRLRALRLGVGVNTYSATGSRQMIERTSGTLHKRT